MTSTSATNTSRRCTPRRHHAGGPAGGTRLRRSGATPPVRLASEVGSRIGGMDRAVLCTIVSLRCGREFRVPGAPMTHEYVVVLTTLPADVDSVAFARSIIDERLAACVNLLAPMESVYRWEEGIEQETERQVIMKTSRERVVALWERVRDLHPYDVPEFIVLPIVDGNDAYLRWVAESTATV